MIKAVIFDLGSVLVGNEWWVIYKKIAQELNISEEKVKEIKRPLLGKWGTGEIDEEKFWEEFEKQAGIKINRKFTKDLWFRTYRDNTKDINKSWEILVELKAQKVDLALITNIIPPHVRANEETGRINKLKDLGFEVLVMSCKIGVCKPDPQIYKITLRELNLPAKACVSVDDILDNIEVAKKLGMQGIHFQTPEKLREDLTKIGLL